MVYSKAAIIKIVFFVRAKLDDDSGDDDDDGTAIIGRHRIKHA